MSVLEKHYTIYNDWEGNSYLGIELDWDYERCKVHLSMILYVKEALIRFNHSIPLRPQDQQHPHIKPKYSQKVQYTEEEDASIPLTAAKTKLVQELLGVFLYYDRATESTMLTALDTIATQQYAPTENTIRKVQQF